MKKIEKYLLSILILIQPFLDTFYVYNLNTEIAGIRIFTLIRITLIFLLGILLIRTTKLKKMRKWLTIYFILLILYVIYHHINATHFISVFPNNLPYSLISECFYLIRYLFPLFLIYYMYTMDTAKKAFTKTIVLYTFFVSASIIISNIFYLSKSSYNDFQIAYNIFDWFTKDISYIFSTSRGFFYSSIVLNVLLLVTPYIYNLYYNEGKYLYLTLIVMNMLALFMVGTKATTYGFLIIAILSVLMYLFFILIKKEKLKIDRILATGMIIVIALLILPYSPAKKRILLTEQLIIESNNIKDNINNDNKIENDNNKTEQNPIEIPEINEYISLEDIIKIPDEKKKEKYAIAYFKKNEAALGVSESLLKAYPYQYDYEFWIDIIINEDAEHKMNNRYIQEKIFKRVKEINNKKISDDLVGITYNRTSAIFNLERDFLYQFYSLGILGEILFLFPLVFLLGICIIKILFTKKMFNYENCSLCFGIGLFLCIAYYSGNTLDNLGMTIILGYVLGFLVAKVFNADKKIQSNPKITIIMPTYNDAESIEETLNSVTSQTYNNWELLISDDGSTDNTKKIIEKYIQKHEESRIKYFYEENQDQLNAVLNVSSQIANEGYILILHSDDILAQKNTLQNIITYFKNNDVDAIISDLPMMNEKGKYIGTQKTRYYKKRNYIPPLQLLWLGRNLYADTFVAKNSIFKNHIKKTYLKWNTPFWLNYENKIHMLNVNKVDFPIIKYRVFEGNYINNEIGKLNVINGEMRTACNLMEFYNIPLYKVQYTLFRIFNKLKLNYIPFYTKKETKNKAEVVEFIIKKRFQVNNNKFLNNLLLFFKNTSERTIYIENINKNDFLYYGKDMRRFNNDLLNNSLSPIYEKILDEMEQGFNKIVIKSAAEREMMEVITKFLCIYPFITIEIAQ